MLVDEPDPTSARMADQEGNMQDDLMEASIIMRHESFLLDGTEPTNTLVDDSASIVADQAWEPRKPSSFTSHDVRTRHGFYSLFMGCNGEKLSLHIPETILFVNGRPSIWLLTSESESTSGHVLRKSSKSINCDAIIEHWTKKYHNRQSRNIEGISAISSNDSPTLITKNVFLNWLQSLKHGRSCCNRIIHQYIKPLNNVGFRSTLTKKGENLISHTSTFRFGHVYKPISKLMHVIYPTRKSASTGVACQEDFR
mmetsp:Transcript_34423/g.107951  ORF Transcript_34423/g.107951 Transcript_34423/m.107951 type:complete len:254 (-) Transcript_34423:289-1050(-)